ncbi:hypothetical protein COW95_02760, partial [Candidatus Peregrinibacteria bacterium CG22_combo_CG10-13_8_21_14_all_49_11]
FAFDSRAKNQVYVLRNDDAVPSLDAFQDPETIEDFLEPYIDGGAIDIQDNQVIFLFELSEVASGTGYSAQDIVLLLSLYDGQ